MSSPTCCPAIRRFALLVIALLAIVLTVPAWAQGSVRHEMLLNKADAGDVSAQYMLGFSYASGIGVDKNPAEAARWYRKAAEQGLAMAQKNLAELLASGNGVARNYIEAYKWYEIAIPNLLDDVARGLLRFERDALAKKMKPGELAEARKSAAEWIKEHRGRTGRKSSPIDASEVGKSVSTSERKWTCDKKPVRGPTPKLWLNPCLLALPVGKWTMIHQQKKGHAVRFDRQEHGASAFDTRRGRIVLFGSDTHTDRFNKVWINSPLLFGVAKLRWLRFYQDDPVATYTVNKRGIPVAGYGGDHPWAMHTYGAVEYDAMRDEIVVSSHPQHLAPGRFTNAFTQLWWRIKRHPTWILSFRTNRWRVLPTQAPSFFLNSTTYDTDRGVVIGYRDDGVFELSGRPRKWRRLTQRGFLADHSNSVYDSKHRAVVVFGNRPVTNAIVMYWPSTGVHRVMPTRGLRPPKDRHAPMAYHPRLERTVVVVDRVPDWARTERLYRSAGTWLYDAGKDAWTRVESAQLSFGLGMNYNMVYDPGHNILLLVVGGRRRNTTVWALRL